MKLGSLDPKLLERPDDGSSLSNRAKSLLDRSLTDLTPSELAFCLRQSIAVPHVARVALTLVINSPFHEAEHYAGDLLISLLRAAELGALDPMLLRELRDVCSEVLADAEIIADTVAPAAVEFVKRYDGAM